MFQGVESGVVILRGGVVAGNGGSTEPNDTV